FVLDMDGGGLGGAVVLAGTVAPVRFLGQLFGYAQPVVIAFPVADPQVVRRVLDSAFVGADLVQLVVVAHIGLSWFAIHTTQYAPLRGYVQRPRPVMASHPVGPGASRSVPPARRPAAPTALIRRGPRKRTGPGPICPGPVRQLCGATAEMCSGVAVEQPGHRTVLEHLADRAGEQRRDGQHRQLRELLVL